MKTTKLLVIESISTSGNDQYCFVVGTFGVSKIERLPESFPAFRIYRDDGTIEDLFCTNVLISYKP